MKVGFVSLGCSKNQLDTEVMLHELLAAGYEITPDETEADVVVINTCAFIESAKKRPSTTFSTLRGSKSTKASKPSWSRGAWSSATAKRC